MNAKDTVELIFTVIGALYTIASAISSAAPNTKVGLACAKVALALRHVTSQKGS